MTVEAKKNASLRGGDSAALFILYSQEQSGLVVNLLRQFQHLKLILSAVVENAQTVAHNLPDHNHSAQEAKKTFNRVSAF